LRAKRDEEALKGLLEPNKHHKAVKAYEKGEVGWRFYRLPK